MPIKEKDEKTKAPEIKQPEPIQENEKADPVLILEKQLANDKVLNDLMASQRKHKPVINNKSKEKDIIAALQYLLSKSD